MGSGETKSNSGFGGFVPVVSVGSVCETTFYRELLEDHDIPVRINQENTQSDGRGPGVVGYGAGKSYRGNSRADSR